MAWYDDAVFYHIYPLGLCGCAHENDGQPVPGAFKKLDAWAEHAAKLGCTAIYIGPLFESGSHGYDTIDYRLVDRRLGTNEEFKEFVAACHERGQKVIVDGVFNHVGRDFFAFQELKEHRENARYRDWFCDVNFWGNNEYNDGFSYGNWGGFNLLVKLNQRNPEVQNYHFDTIRFWVDKFDIDGIRLDAADVLDFDFMKGLRRLANEVKPEFWLMGEVIHGDYSRWVNGQTLHSVTNYALHKALYSGHNDHNYFEIAHTVKYLQNMGDLDLYNFVDNHDVTRVASILSNEKHLPLIYAMCFGMPGIPCVYYGSEWGTRADKREGDPALRPCFEQPEWNELSEFISKLAEAKKNSEALNYGSFRSVLLTNRQCIFERASGHERVMVAINADGAPFTAHFDAGCGMATDLITGQPHDFGGGSELPPYSAAFWKMER